MCYIDSPGYAQQGWQCPICRTVNAPWSPICYGCPPKIPPTTGGGTGTGDTPPSLWPTTISVTISGEDQMLVNDAAQFTAVEGIQAEFNYGPFPQPEPYWRKPH